MSAPDNHKDAHAGPYIPSSSPGRVSSTIPYNQLEESYIPSSSPVPSTTGSQGMLNPHLTGPTASSISPQITGPTVSSISPQITGYQEQQPKSVPRFPIIHQPARLSQISDTYFSPSQPQEPPQILAPQPVSYCSLPQYQSPQLQAPVSVSPTSVSIQSEPIVPPPPPHLPQSSLPPPPQEPQRQLQSLEYDDPEKAFPYTPSASAAKGAKTITIFGKRVTMEAVIVLSILAVVIIAVSAGIGAWLKSKEAKHLMAGWNHHNNAPGGGRYDFCAILPISKEHRMECYKWP